MGNHGEVAAEQRAHDQVAGGLSRDGGRAALLAAAGALVFFVVAGLTESALIRVLHPTALELDWVSDAILSAALGVASYLWLHLRTTRRELTTLERAEVVLNAQLSIAEDMQRRLLGSTPAAGRIEWAARLTAAGRIGGDFYDFVEPVAGEQMVLIADVSGKGIPAAMALSLLRASFRYFAQQTRRPAALAAALSNAFHDEWDGAPYVTALIVHVDSGARTLTYTNAGHPVGVFLHGAGDQSLGAGGPPLGLLPGATFDEESLSLAAGDVCLLVTDGVTESLDGGEASPRAWLIERTRAPAASAQQICDRIMAGALAHNGPRGVVDWTDDRTVIAGIVREA